MKKFLTLTSIFSLLLIVSFYLVLLKADGYTDPFYLRFTSPRQYSLIIGTSRAAQGIQPKILNQILSRNDIYNYSFTVGHSPYGPTYLKSIKRKLQTDSKEGIFIVAVDPWSISCLGENPEDSTKFEELGLALSGTYFVNMKPNIPYLFKYYDKGFWNLFVKPDSSLFLHDDGWFEVSVPMDSVTLEKRIEDKILDYRKNYLPAYKFSTIRYNYTIKTIEYLKKHGTVYLVRLPIHPLMMEIEQELMPDFNDKIQKISNAANVDYLDMTYLNQSFIFTDGNHLFKSSGIQATEIIGKWIIEKKLTNNK
jgi:hypothetical protein